MTNFLTHPRTPNRGSSLGALVGLLAFPWVIYTLAVILSVLGTHPLQGRGTTIAILLVGFGGTIACWLIGRGTTLAPAAHSTDDGALRFPLATVLSLAGATAYLTSFVLAIALPVVAYDALAYRLPTIASWLDSGRIAWVASDDPVRNGYPLGQEVVSAVIARATESMRFVGATSFLYVAAGAFSLSMLAEACGVRRALARAAAAIFLLVPMVILNAPSGYVDAAFAGMTIALFCTAALLVEHAPADPWLAAATGMAAAQVLALKGNGIAVVALVAGGATLRAWQTGASKGRLVVAGAWAAPGTFFVLRNIVHTGNPLWPVELRLAGHTVFPGVGTMSQILDVTHNTPAAFAVLGESGRIARTWLETAGPAIDFDDRLAGLGWAWPMIALPAIGAYLWHHVRRENRIAPVMFVLVLTAATFVVQPMRWWPRYTLWVWGAGVLCVGVEAERLARTGRARLLSRLLVPAAALLVGEGTFALAHANGVSRALARGGILTDPEDAKNASSWIRPEFFRLGIDRQKDVCRGAWKPGTDNANLDGVVAQLTPRARVHVVPDDASSWPLVRRAWQEAGCSELLLFPGSPVLPGAASDPSVSVESAVAFDPLFVVRPHSVAIATHGSP